MQYLFPFDKGALIFETTLSLNWLLSRPAAGPHRFAGGGLSCGGQPDFLVQPADLHAPEPAAGRGGDSGAVRGEIAVGGLSAVGAVHRLRARGLGGWGG